MKKGVEWIENGMKIGCEMEEEILDIGSSTRVAIDLI